MGMLLDTVIYFKYCQQGDSYTTSRLRADEEKEKAYKFLSGAGK
jgi:hypothetical protein